MQIIVRYITKEIALAFITVTGLLFLILLSNRFSVYLAKAASGELPVGVVFEMAYLYSPELLSYLLPVGMYMGILFAYGRLYTDSEMTVLSACGVSMARIMRITLLFATLGGFLTAFLTLWVVPRVATLRENVLTNNATLGLMGSLVPQRFQSMDDDKSIVYLEQVSKEEGLRGVFMAQRPMDVASDQEEGFVLMSAKTAELQSHRQEGSEENLYVILKEGYRYQGVPGKANYSVIAFQEYGRALINLNTVHTVSDDMRLKKSRDLWGLDNAEASAELQWRFSLPLSVLVLAVMAIPLSRVHPRQGRFSRVLPAVILYVLYYNLFTVCRRWVATGALAASVGSWWVHGLFLGVGFWVIVRDQKRLG